MQNGSRCLQDGIVHLSFFSAPKCMDQVLTSGPPLAYLQNSSFVARSFRCFFDWERNVAQSEFYDCGWISEGIGPLTFCCSCGFYCSGLRHSVHHQGVTGWVVNWTSISFAGFKWHWPTWKDLRSIWNTTGSPMAGYDCSSWLCWISVFSTSAFPVSFPSG